MIRGILVWLMDWFGHTVNIEMDWDSGAMHDRMSSYYDNNVRDVLLEHHLTSRDMINHLGYKSDYVGEYCKSDVYKKSKCLQSS